MNKGLIVSTILYYRHSELNSKDVRGKVKKETLNENVNLMILLIIFVVSGCLIGKHFRSMKM